MIIARALIDRSCSAQSSRHAVASGANASAKIARVSLAGATNLTCMKKRPVPASPCCAFSTMLQSCETSELATAATMPLRSSQANRRTYRRLSGIAVGVIAGGLARAAALRDGPIED